MLNVLFIQRTFNKMMAARTGFFIIMTLILVLRIGMLEKLLYSIYATQKLYICAVLNLDLRASTLCFTIQNVGLYASCNNQID